jgi:ribosome-binding ATPase
MRFGLIGLGASGKTSLFNVLTGRTEAVGTYGANPGAVNAMASVPDSRLDDTAAAFKPEKTTHASFEVLDITGLFEEKGKVSGEQVALAREVDGLGIVIRAFQDPGVPHPLERVDARADLDFVHAELVLADQMVCDKRLDKIRSTLKKPVPNKDALLKEQEVLQRCMKELESGGRVASLGLSPDESKLLRSYRFLTELPQIVILNVGESDAGKADTAAAQFKLPETQVTTVCGKLEMELAQLDPGDRAAFMADLGIKEPARDRLVRSIYQRLGLISFITFGEDECRAWTIPAGANALAAAGAIHTDLARGFIRAAVYHFDDWVAAGRDEKKIKAAGKLRLEGKDYAVKDGDMIVIRFSV